MYFDSYITLKLKPRAGKNNLINEGFRQATLNCCKSVQRKEFLSDLTKLLNNQDLPSKSKLLCLAPLVDQEGVGDLDIHSLQMIRNIQFYCQNNITSPN